MRITSWNFLHGQPLDPAATAEISEILAEFSSDVLSLQEVDHQLPRSQGKKQSQEIAQELKTQWWGFAPAISGTPGVKWRKLAQHEQRVITQAEADVHSQPGADQPGADQFYGIAIISKLQVLQWHRLELGRSLIGMPLAVGNAKGRMALIYVKDEPRVAMAAVLENGWIVINTHLSFVPLVNIYQLFKLARWAKKLEIECGGEVLLTGDFNLPWGIPSRLLPFKRATQANSYPSWKPAISFDYILARSNNLAKMREHHHSAIAISDHRPLSVDITQK
jgi:endonuclease/exonuclease/phosphatase family metal-dependent hydrolase